MAKKITTKPADPSPQVRLDAKEIATDDLVRTIPFNKNKVHEFGANEPNKTPEGFTSETDSIDVSASTISESNLNPKNGARNIDVGENANDGTLLRSRVDSNTQGLTTNQGVPIADNQNTLKAGLRGPTLLEDFILREKITHFDHERIPERIVHARGSAAHGYFECYADMKKYTAAAPFQKAGKRTPVFTRFSTVAGERGSTDTARDVRGFAVKFYTDEGNWDLVGNNMPVFFIQDAMKFPDVIHAVKPEPHHAMPQASSAHDTFWDFISLMPESTHMIMWVMSDRAIPRSYRMMQGFGVHSYRLINEKGESVFVKFHWTPKQGTHSLVWDEAVKISGADPDFHRRDLWEAIEAGAYPEWELGFQIFTEEQAEKFSFDILDSTKIIPEELVPVTPVGKMVLDRNPDNFFAETEQVAYCTANIIRGIDFSNDPLLGGRIHSYFDTQLSRLGGPNFHEIPINSPVVPVHNNQRDGLHRQAVARGRVSYEPNSLGGGCPYQFGSKGFATFPEPVEQDKVRGKPEKFADHYTQATLFYNSQTQWEKNHITSALRFELSKVSVPAIRERMIAGLRNVDEDLAQKVADGLGMPLPEPLPKVLPDPVKPEVLESPKLSLTAIKGNTGIQSRCIAILVADGVDERAITKLYAALKMEGAVPRFIGPRIGTLVTAGGGTIEAEASLENSPSVLFDALVLPDGDDGVGQLLAYGQTLEFITHQYRHCKPIMAIGASEDLLTAAEIDGTLENGSDDPGIIYSSTGDKNMIKLFKEAVSMHRFPERETDPPVI